MSKAAIFDLDNCLADDLWRIPRINRSLRNPDDVYREYHALAAFDAPANKNFWATYRDTHRIIVLTARPNDIRAQTEEWLRRHFARPYALIMRNVGDHTPSVDLKRKMVCWLPEYGVDLGDIDCAYDDRREIVEMYQALGIKAARLWVHDEDAETGVKL